MRKSFRSLLFVAVAASLTACGDDYLTTEPQTILTEEVVWTNPNLIRGVLADFYSRMPQYQGFHGVQSRVAQEHTSYDEALWSSITSTGNDGTPNEIAQYAYARWRLFDGCPCPGNNNPDNPGSSYGLIRDINLGIENLSKASGPTLNPVKASLLAELRFQRAWVYFEHVKRMGGVPIITEQQVYDFSGNPSYLQHPRDSEAAVYDFIASEVDAIVGDLGNAGSQTRANRYTALALKSRAMLYAGSLANYNSQMAAPITLPNGVVGIPASRAAEYYQKSLDASRAIISSGAYSLYRGNADPRQNFYEALTVKSGNPETIWARGYNAGQGLSHLWTLNAVPRSLRIDIDGSGVSPALQLAETFDYLNGAPGTFPGVGNGTVAGQANWTYYDNVRDIFETVNGGKDGRFWGTIVYPGTNIRGGTVQMQAGLYVWNAASNRYDKVEGQSNSQYTDSQGRTLTLTGADGPRFNESYMGNTGFLLRKYVDETAAAGTLATRSDIQWIYFRLGEIYLNATEAAFELGLQGEALGHINTLRQRAGFPANSKTSLTIQDIRNERRVELAFEDHRLWDVKRWRIAHEIWDGSQTSTTANMWVLFPYRIVRPGHPHDGKWVFDRFKSPEQKQPRFFRLGNYYSAIPSNVLGQNPNIVPNPFH